VPATRSRKKKHRNTRKCGNYVDVLPLNATRRDSISNLTSFGASMHAVQCSSPTSLTGFDGIETIKI